MKRFRRIYHTEHYGVIRNQYFEVLYRYDRLQVNACTLMLLSVMKLMKFSTSYLSLTNSMIYQLLHHMGVG